MPRVVILPLVAFSLLLLSTSAARAEREVRIKCSTPSPGESIKIIHVWKVGDELWSISQTKSAGGIQPAVIGSAGDSVKVDADKDAKLRHFVIKGWGWWEGDKAEFIKSVDELKEKMKKDGKKIDAVLYPKAEKKKG